MDPRLMRFYDERLRRYGADDARGVGWRNSRSQEVRFRVLTEIGNLAGASVLDEGCGTGALYGYLAEHFPTARYHGIDVNADAIAAAREKYPEGSFEVADFSGYAGEYADYVLSSGALTFRIENHADIYREHIRKMFELSRIGAAFNVLDARAIQEDDEYLGYDPAELLAFCQGLTLKVALRHDYSDEDFTLYLYH